jgi:hypothetical protein
MDILAFRDQRLYIFSSFLQVSLHKLNVHNGKDI